MAHASDRFFLLAGVAGPVIFALAIFLSGMLHPGYNHAENVISQLGAIDSPASLLMNVFGFMLMGISIVAFSFGFYKLRGDTILGKLITVLFALGGLGMFLIGTYPCDAGCFNQSPTGLMHNFVTPLPYLPLFAAFILLVADVSLVRKEGTMKYYFAVAGLLGAATVYFAFIWLTHSLPTGEGFVQRLAIGVPFTLLMYTAWKLYRLKKRKK